MGKVDDAAARLSTAIEHLELSLGTIPPHLRSAARSQQPLPNASPAQNLSKNTPQGLDAHLSELERSIDESIEELESLLFKNGS